MVALSAVMSSGSQQTTDSASLGKRRFKEVVMAQSFFPSNLGERKERVKGLMKEFEAKIGIETLEAPDDLREMFSNMGSQLLMMIQMANFRCN